MNDVASLLEAQQAVIDRLKRELEIAGKAALALHARNEQLEAIIADLQPQGDRN
jgi:hypothetical protein